VSSEERSVSSLRELTDPLAMRAIAHPVRLSLLEALTREGPLTATEAGELIGENPATCSFHFRQLAKYGFVEEAGSGPGRRRPWKLAHVGLRFTDMHEDAETAVAATALERTLRARHLARMDAAMQERHSYPPEWREATGQSQFLLYLTPEEMKALDSEITEALFRYRDRLTDHSKRPKGSRAVEVLLFGYLAD
jgi:predicted transcriptional regulator